MGTINSPYKPWTKHQQRFDVTKAIRDQDIRSTVDLANRAKTASDWAAAAELYSQVHFAVNNGGLVLVADAADGARISDYFSQQAQYCLSMEQLRLQREANAINSEVETSLRALLARQKDTNETLEELPRQLRRQIESIG